MGLVSRGTAILVTLIAYKLMLVAVGVWASRRASDSADDYFVGGRSLGPWVAGLSASASSSSAWTILGVSGFAYTQGVSSLWLIPACIGGFCINWFVLAPGIRRRAHARRAVTATDMLIDAQDPGPWPRRVTWLASLLVLASLATYVAAQFQGAAASLASTFDIAMLEALLIGAGVVVLYTLLGGFWAVSVTDTIQGVAMAVAAVVVPIAALHAVGGPGQLLAQLRAVEPSLVRPANGLGWVGGTGFVVGLLGIGLAYPGQPHVVNRLMALRDEQAMRHGRTISIVWAAIMYTGMIVVGLAARVLFPSLEGPGGQEGAFVAIVDALFHPVLAGVMLAAVLSAIMSTADSQLLVAAATVDHDLMGSKGGVKVSRMVVLGLSCVAIALAALVQPEIFSSVLFAFSTLGAAFGPTLVAVALGRRLDARWVFVAVALGAALAIAAFAFEATRGTYWERVVPVVVGAAIVWATSGRRPLEHGDEAGQSSPSSP